MAKKTADSGVVYQLKITLRDVKPPVWRRVQVKDCTLGKLHDIIQTCMGWDGGHLHAFEIGGEQYGEPDPTGMMDVTEMKNESRIKLSQVVNQGHKKFTYTYVLDTNPNDLVISFTGTWVLDPIPHNPEKGGVQPKQVSGQRLITLTTCSEIFHTDNRMIAFGHLVKVVKKQPVAKPSAPATTSGG
jgi:hypothetical protein